MNLEQNNPSPLGYDETTDKIAIRINAHKHYSNFSLEQWLCRELNWDKGSMLLDLGCGSGNFFQVYVGILGTEGLIVGVDKSVDLLRQAAAVECGCRRILLEWDINSDLPLIDPGFDYLISTFAIYYADDPMATMNRIRNALRPGGEFCLIGPTDRNAGELYTFNKSIFGFERYDKLDERTSRLERQFLQAAQGLFAKVSHEKIGSRLIFPDAMEFVRYYRATLLFEESVRIVGNEPSLDELLAKARDFREVSKEMIAVRGRK